MGSFGNGSEYGIFQRDGETLSLHSNWGGILKERAELSTFPLVEVKEVLFLHDQAQKRLTRLTPPNKDSAWDGLTREWLEGKGLPYEPADLFSDFHPGNQPSVQRGSVFPFHPFAQAGVLRRSVITRKSGQETMAGRLRGREVGSKRVGLGLSLASRASWQNRPKEGKEQGHGEAGHVSYLGRSSPQGQLRFWCFSFLLATACSDSQPNWVQFENPVQDLGTVVEGKQIALVFPFQVGQEPVQIQQLQPGCGCLSPQLLIGGSPVSFPYEASAGTQGEVLVIYSTVGIHGVKNTPVNVLGTGPGLPARLEVRSVVEPWFVAEPSIMRLGRISAEESHRIPLKVSGPKPFRFIKALALPEGYRWEGVPSAESSVTQELALLLPPGDPGPRESDFLRLQADNELRFVMPLVFERVGAVWSRPSRIFPLGVLRSGIETQASLDCGATEGTLEVLETEILGIPDSRVDSVTLEESASWRIRFTLPSTLPLGPVHGEIRIRLRHQVGENIRELERNVRIVGLVQDSQKNSDSNR